MSLAGTVTGLVLAAGAGRRAGGPKALRRDASGQPWLLRSVRVLLDGGCAEVVVVLGAGAAEAEALLADHPVVAGSRAAAVRVVREPGWANGLSRSLRRGLETVGAGRGSAALVHLVDLPDVPAEAVRRVLSTAPPGPGSLARAAYGGRPGHPVLIGRDHIPAVLAGLSLDRGARAYLNRHDALLVECGDLARGGDEDGPPTVAG